MNVPPSDEVLFEEFSRYVDANLIEESELRRRMRQFYGLRRVSNPAPQIRPKGAWRLLRAEVKLKPQDLWIGVYWEAQPGRLNVWVCLLPIVPLHLEFTRGS